MFVGACANSHSRTHACHPTSLKCLIFAIDYREFPRGTNPQLRVARRYCLARALAVLDKVDELARQVGHHVIQRLKNGVQVMTAIIDGNVDLTPRQDLREKATVLFVLVEGVQLGQLSLKCPPAAKIGDPSL